MKKLLTPLIIILILISVGCSLNDNNPTIDESDISTQTTLEADPEPVNSSKSKKINETVDYSVIDPKTGSNPIVAHEYLGISPAGKDVIVVDDMISSGGSMIDTAKRLKEMGAKRIFVFSTFGLFTNGMEKFDAAHERGDITRIFTTNLTYQSPELLSRTDYYTSVDMSKFVSYIIDTLNHNASISDLLDPTNRIKSLIEKYNNGELNQDSAFDNIE